MIISSNIVLLKVLQQTTIAKRKSLKCGHHSKYKFSNSIQYYNLVFVFYGFLITLYTIDNDFSDLFQVEAKN